MSIRSAEEVTVTENCEVSCLRDGEARIWLRATTFVATSKRSIGMPRIREYEYEVVAPRNRTTDSEVRIKAGFERYSTVATVIVSGAGALVSLPLKRKEEQNI